MALVMFLVAYAFSKQKEPTFDDEEDDPDAEKDMVRMNAVYSTNANTKRWCCVLQQEIDELEKECEKEGIDPYNLEDSGPAPAPALPEKPVSAALPK